VIVPLDHVEPHHEVRGTIEIFRYRYGLFSRGRVAFGLGIAPNIAQTPALLGQIPGLLIGMFRAARRFVRAGDIVLANWLAAGCVGWALYRFFKIPYIVVLRGGDTKLLSAAPRLFRRVLADARTVVAVSESLKNAVSESIPTLAGAIQVIGNGVTFSPPSIDELAQFLVARGLRKGRYLLFVGSVIPRKRIEILFEILSTGCLIDYDLVVCGRIEAGGYRSELIESARKLGVFDRVRFEGLVPPNEIPLFLAGAAAYLSAADFEGRPNGLLEALAAGLPCAASNIPAHRELIVDGENGLLFEYDDLPGTAQRIRQLLDDRNRVRTFAVMAQARVAEYSWERCAERYRTALLEDHKLPR
jgi:glycosyltransferase involved in cell wall biosynthesis